MKFTDEQLLRYTAIGAAVVFDDANGERRVGEIRLLATEAIAEAAVTEVLTRMIAEIGFYTTALYQYDTTFEDVVMSEGPSVEELIRSYLPTPAPTADEGAETE